MKWKKFTLKTLAEAEDIVIATLAEAGIEGVEIEDKGAADGEGQGRCLWTFCRMRLTTTVLLT